MKSASKSWRFGLAAAALLVGTVVCGSMLGRSGEDLLVNPAFHTIVSDEHPVPREGTFDFDTRVFNIDYTEEIDLAAMDERIVGALTAELERKGYERDTEDPDLLVSYAVAIDSSLAASDLNAAYADEFPVSVPEPEPGQELEYQQGAVIVDFVDGRSRTLLWRGSIMAEVDMDVTEREKHRRARYGAGILLRHFPAPVVSEP
jgi:hypothetical protein